MRRFAITLGAVSILALALTTLNSHSGAQERHEHQAKVADDELFGGKPVYMDCASNNWFYFEKVRLGTIGNKNYFVGVVARLKNTHSAGKTYWLLQEHVPVIRVFDSLGQLQEWVDSFDNEAPAR